MSEKELNEKTRLIQEGTIRKKKDKKKKKTKNLTKEEIKRKEEKELRAKIISEKISKVFNWD